jgi:hypothetical protein
MTLPNTWAVGTTYPALPGSLAVPETHPFSKELVAYLETLNAFSCYYRADDSRMAGKMEQYSSQALACYKDYKYPDWQKYIAQKMTDWYKVFLFETTKAIVDVDVEAEEVEEGTVVEAPPVVASGASGVYRMSPSGSEDEGCEGCKGGEGGGEGGEGSGLRDGDILANRETAEDNVTAAAAEARPGRPGRRRRCCCWALN